MLAIVALNRLFLALAAAALAAQAAHALSAEEVERRVRVLSDELRCPTCQALSVKDSDAGFSVQIREKVKHMVEEGQSDEDIKAYFVTRYGEWILRAPKKQGVGLILWVLPIAGIVLVGALLVWRIRHAGHAAPALAPVSALSPEQRERLERDLKRFQRED